MTTQYAGLDVWSETLDIVTDDDVRDASSYAISAIGLGDRTRYLKNRGFYSTPAFGVDPYTNLGNYRIGGQIIFTAPMGIAITHLSARTYARVSKFATYAKPTYWENGLQLSGPLARYKQLSVLTAALDELLVFDLDIPSNCTVVSIKVRVEPAVHSTIPTNKPNFLVYLSDSDAGTTTLVSSGSDPSVDATQYNLPHNVVATLSQVFDASKHKLWIRFFGETDALANALVNLVVHLPIVEFEREQIGEEFGELVP